VSDEGDVRRLALALPEACEDQHRGKPTFRVNKRIFAMLRGEARAARLGESMFSPLEGDRPVALVKLEREEQLNLVAGHPDAITPASEYAQHGWTHVWLDEIDEPDLATVIRLAWLCVAPKRLSKAPG
jgi:hypothetical protein